MFSFFQEFFKVANNQAVDIPSNIIELIKKYRCDRETPTKKNLERLIRRIASEGVVDDLRQLLTSHILNELDIDIDARNKDGLNALGYIEKGLKRTRISSHEQCKSILFEYKNTQFQKKITRMTVDAICQFLDQAIKEENWVGVKIICDLPAGPNKPTDLYNAVYQLEKSYKAKEHLLTEGPFKKSVATLQLEILMRKLMQTGRFTIKSGGKHDVIFTFDDEQFNWSEIIKKAHLEHIILTELDFMLYQNYMESLKQNDLIDEQEMFAYLPTLEREKTSIYQNKLYKGIRKDNDIQFEEMSAINIYTGILFFSSINGLIRGDSSLFEEDSIFKSKPMQIRHAVVQLVMCASGLNKLSLPTVLTTYRGEGLYYSQEVLNERIKVAAQNAVLSLNGFVSTSIKEDHPYTKSSVQYTFYNVRGICIAPISRFPDIEQELIMLPTQVQLLSYKFDNKQHFFEGRCVRGLNNNDRIDYSPVLYGAVLERQLSLSHIIASTNINSDSRGVSQNLIINASSKEDFLRILEEKLKEQAFTRGYILDLFSQLKKRDGDYRYIHQQRNPMWDKVRLFFKSHVYGYGQDENKFWHTATYQKAVKLLKDAYVARVDDESGNNRQVEANVLIDYVRGNSPVHYRETSTRKLGSSAHL
jgi:hypothetical protein